MNESVASVEGDVSIEELERRMRPGKYSQLGFLGKNESLLEVLASDDETVKMLGLSHNAIANRIEYFLECRFFGTPLEIDERYPLVSPDQFRTKREYRKASREALEARARERGIVDGIYRIDFWAYGGSQICPWQEEAYFKPNSDELYVPGPLPYSNTDFKIENIRTGKTLQFPGLIIHLIRRHHFYEGKKSPYRVDPERTVRVLDIR